MNILETIIAHKRKELEELIRQKPVKTLEGSDYFTRNTISLTESILSPLKTGIIAEFKRKSPSKGLINSEASVEEVTTGYSREGASGLSILTDHEYFGGNNTDLILARRLNQIPVLRKDFIIDEYQVIESKAIGADAVLLIASALRKNRILELARLARSLGLQVLLEVHNKGEIDLANEYINIVGVNNRDLKTFEVNTEKSYELADKIPGTFVKISESGISSPETIKKLKEAGYQGFLIGGKFMQNPDPVSAFADFVKLLKTEYAEN